MMLGLSICAPSVTVGVLIILIWIKLLSLLFKSADTSTGLKWPQLERLRDSFRWILSRVIESLCWIAQKTPLLQRLTLWKNLENYVTLHLNGIEEKPEFPQEGILTEYKPGMLVWVFQGEHNTTLLNNLIGKNSNGLLGEVITILDNMHTYIVKIPMVQEEDIVNHGKYVNFVVEHRNLRLRLSSNYGREDDE